MQRVWPDRLRAKLKPRGKQAEVARILDVDDSTISGYKSGRRVPSADDLVQLCEALNMTPQYLLGFTNVDTPLQAEMGSPRVSERPAPTEVRWCCPNCGANLQTTLVDSYGGKP